ncbi:hypothetical protein HMI55_006049 [Coelomomyces lativittatus]|nr:hypothetical protein HMI55_006049 [Coelomomyces lativittatus]KAJ1514040.1 hypothetical protein HMI56_001282 [Coelomomyces lativittatus]
MCPAEENLLISQNKDALSSSDDTLLDVPSSKWDNGNFISFQFQNFGLNNSKPNFKSRSFSSSLIRKSSSSSILNEKQSFPNDSAPTRPIPFSFKNKAVNSCTSRDGLKSTSHQSTFSSCSFFKYV